MKRYLIWSLLLAVSGLLIAFVGIDTVLQESVRQAKPDSTITYILKHPLHTVHGTSHQVSSRLGVADNGESIQRVEVSVPVRSFDSGSRARDRDMLEVTEAQLFPTVAFTSTRIVEQGGQLNVTGQLTFHGVTHEISFLAKPRREGEELVVEGGFDISLETYQIKRPSIFSMKVKDTLHVQFTMLFPAGKDRT